MAYCNATTDLTDLFPRLFQLDLKWEIKNWTATTGQSLTYEKSGTGNVYFLYENGTRLVEKTSIATVEATAATWWYDSDIDKLYVHPTGDGDPADFTIEKGEDWDTFLDDRIDEASQMMDAWLNKVMITPLIARDSKDHNTDNYEFPIKQSCAAIACYLILNRVEPGNPEAMKLFKIAWNSDTANNPLPEGERKGWINMYLDGDMVRQDDVSPRESGNYNIFPYASNTTAEPGIELEGMYSGTTFQHWRLMISTGGALGTMIYKLSTDGGNNYDYTNLLTYSDQDDQFYTLIGGLRVRFPASTYTANDYWDIRVYPQDSTLERGAKINSYRLTRT